jgi:hypothetical protein
MLTVEGSNARRGILHQQQELTVEQGPGECNSPASLAMVTDLGGIDQFYRRVTICALPDDVLLEIFDFYVNHPDVDWGTHKDNTWHRLVHVCQQWRHVVFASPRRLNLRLLCTNRTPAQNMLDVWPQLPIVIRPDHNHPRMSRPQDTRNIIAALKLHNRVCKIYFWYYIPNLLLRKIGAITEPFPALTHLELQSRDKRAPRLPNSFLGGSAPRLRLLRLGGVPFPALSKLLSSTHDLVTLHLYDIPHSGYISPEAMVITLSTLTRLQELTLRFRSPRSPVDRANRHSLPFTCVALPALTSLRFKGDSEYLEVIVFRIDTPLLGHLTIEFFNQLLFETPLLGHFISRTEIFKTSNHAVAGFHNTCIELRVFSRRSELLELWISCKPCDWQLSSLAQVCSSCLSPLPTLERLEIFHSRLRWQDDIENMQWLELLHPFTSVKQLVLYSKIVGLVAPALQELTGERVTDVLPALQRLLLIGPRRSGPIKKAIAQFVAARQIFGRPVAILQEG